MSLVIKDLTVDHGAIRAISEVSFAVETGKLSAVIGANGAGKSTLLRTLSGLNKATEGSAHWGDHNPNALTVFHYPTRFHYDLKALYYLIAAIGKDAIGVNRAIEIAREIECGLFFGVHRHLGRRAATQE